jgi:hypothetical protein
MDDGKGAAEEEGVMTMHDETPLTQPEKHVLLHALGVNSTGKIYRRHFCASKGTPDHVRCLALEQRGLMVMRPGEQAPALRTFLVTPQGIEYAQQHYGPFKV